MYTMRHVCPLAVIAAFLESIVLHAQTTNPLDLLKEGAAPGERISYEGGDLQFGELRVPADTGSHPLAILVQGLLAGQDEPGSIEPLLQPDPPAPLGMKRVRLDLELQERLVD